jgi:hypothetical protein
MMEVIYLKVVLMRRVLLWSWWRLMAGMRPQFIDI